MNIFISASELAILTGHNRYREKTELIVKYWKKYFFKDFRRIETLLKKSNRKVSLPETAHETVKRIATENNIDTQQIQKLYSASKNANVSTMQKDKQSVLSEILKSVPIKEQKKLTQSANSLVYTTFGTRNEYSGIDLFKEKYKVDVRTPTSYFSEELFIIDHGDDTHTWSIGGKIDGIYTNSDGDEVILEIKNRVNKLFLSLRDYEKVQCYAYMYVLDKKKVNLAECYKKQDEITMNVIDIHWDDEFWRKDIVENLSNFVDDFYEFLENDNYKIKLIS